ncbi:MAG: DNA-processing protein DprA [Planctomycetes bacterium]|nr:DNA-processing protein DprA [Planctomycetota bacterium]
MTVSEDLRALVAINLSGGIGWTIYGRLLERFGTPEGILGAPAGQLQEVRALGAARAAALHNVIETGAVDDELKCAEEHNITILPHTGDDYPAALRHIPTPPLILYVQGELRKTDAVALAFVGSRRASIYGLKAARRLAGQAAAAGFTVVSGLARGIDQAAHRAALEVGGRTIGVVGSGLSVIYPAGSEKLVSQIAASGAVVSEFPLTFGPLKGNFPRRNRIISGLSLGVVVVEAARRSGSLITARHAGEQGKEVFAVPGQIGSASSFGANRLIQDGAKLVLDLADITTELGVLDAPVDLPGMEAVEDLRSMSLNDVERRVFNAVDEKGVSVEDVIVGTELAAQTVSSTLLILEMKRLVRQLSGNRFAKY